MKRASNLPRRALATGLAACAHLAVLLLLGWRIPRLVVPTRSEDDSAAIEVTLVRPSAPPRPQAPRAGPLASAATARVLTVPSPQAPPLAAPGPTAPAPVPTTVEGSANDEHLRNALRGLVGCSNQMTLRLSSEERAACDRRLAAAAPAPVARQFSAEEVRGFEADKQESIFTRKPHNGCLPHAGNTPGPIGSGAGNTTVGIACGWSFW